MIAHDSVLPMTRQASPLRLSRSSVYYLPRPATTHRIASLHLERPFAGSRMLSIEGLTIGRLAVAMLMRWMGMDTRTRNE